VRIGPYRAHKADMKVGMKTAQTAVNADVLATGHPDELREETVIHHPKVIDEGLSGDKAAYGKRAPFAADHQLERLEESARIGPHRPTIEVHRRMAGGDRLLAASVSGQGLVLESPGFAAAPAAVFVDLDSGDA